MSVKKKSKSNIQESKIKNSSEDISKVSDKTVRSGGVMSQIKLFFVTVFIVMVVFAVGYIYLWYQSVITIQNESSAILVKQERLELLEQDFTVAKKSLSDQLNSCQELMLQGSGDFSQFEYCKKFVEWSKNLPETLTKN